jgi:L-xylulokinase
MYGTGITDPVGLVVMSGTWGLHQSFLERPVTDGSLVIVAHGAVPGQWLAIEGSPTSATCFEWFVDTFVRRSADEPSEALYELCAARLAETLADGPAVYFLPFINGAIDDASARGTLVGLSGWHHLGHAVRAVFEGVAFEHRRHLERLLRRRPRPERARFAGGAARSRPWSEIFAAALDLTLATPRGSEFGAAGAAVLASVAAGLSPDIPMAAGAMTRVARTIEPDPALKAILDRRYGVYRRLLEALGPCWGEITG